MTRESGARTGPSFATDLAFARRLADEAARLALEYFRRGVAAKLEPDGSQVTEADVAVERRLRVGVITRPVHGSSRWASRGAGAHRSGTGADTRLAVSAMSALQDRRVSLWTHAEDPTRQRLEQHCRWVHPDLDCLLRLAEGQLEALVDRSGKPWDLAPAVVLVEEAGGRYSVPTGGRRLDLGDGRFSNGLVHGELAALLAASG